MIMIDGDNGDDNDDDDDDDDDNPVAHIFTCY